MPHPLESISADKQIKDLLEDQYISGQQTNQQGLTHPQFITL